MIQVEVQKNKILKEDIEFGVGAVTQTRGDSSFNGNKVNVAEMPYSLTQTFGQKVTEIQTQYDYIIANVASDPGAVPMTNLIRKSGNDLVDNLGAVFTPQVIDSASALEASYVKKLWVKIISSTEHHLKRGSDIIAMFNPVTHAQIFTFDYAAIAAALTSLFGTAAQEDVGIAAGNVVQLDGTGKLPAVDASQLINLPLTIGVPIGGAVINFANTIPADFLECNGSAISRTTYAALFAAIGVSYGAGDGSTTFQLPETRGEFIRGWDNGRGIDSGRAFATMQADELKEHQHTITSQVNGTFFQRYQAGSTYLAGIDFAGATENTGGTETRPRNIAAMYIIRYQ